MYYLSIYIRFTDFGRGQNVATGSPVCLDFANGTKVNLQWGIPKQLWQTLPMKANGDSEQVKASRVEAKWDYFATLSGRITRFEQTVFVKLAPIFKFSSGLLK